MDRRTSMYLLTIVFREYGEMAVEDMSRIMVVFLDNSEVQIRNQHVVTELLKQEDLFCP